MKVCAIIVTYNPYISQFLDYLKTNIEQVDHIIIVDNSEIDDTKKIINKLSENINIEIISLTQNHGIAYAQNLGIEKIINENIYDFVLFLDQDSKLCNDAISIYKKYYIELSCQHKLACLGSGDPRNKGFVEKGALEVRQILSSGSFIHVSTFSTVGVMNEGMFIDFVDFEWCWRAASKGFKIFSISEVSLIHKEGDEVVYIFGQKIAIPSPLRHYYQYRNFLYLLCVKHVPFCWKIVKTFKMIAKIPVYIAITDQLQKRLFYIYKGTEDFIAGKNGKYLS